MDELEKLGWEKISDGYYKYGNRYIDVDFPYIDIYTYDYKEGEKYKGWLSDEELNSLNEIINRMRG